MAHGRGKIDARQQPERNLEQRVAREERRHHPTELIVNVGPFDLVLQEDDVIAQLTVAKITSPPEEGMNLTSATYGSVA